MVAKRELGSALIVALAVGTGGVALGFVWYLVAPPLPLKKVEGGLAYLGPDPEQPVAADGWFVILGFAFGIIAAVLVWHLARSKRGPLQLIGLILGAIAAAFVAWKVGIDIADQSYQKRVAEAKLGDIVERPIDLAVTDTRNCLPFLDRCFTLSGGDLLVPALGGVVGYTLLAGWSRWPGLRREEEEEVEPQPVIPVSSAME